MRCFIQLSILATLVFICTPAKANPKGYQKPSPELASLVEQPSKMGMRLSPDNKLFAQLVRSDKITLNELAQPEYQLAGLSLSQSYHGASRYKTIYKHINLITLDGTLSHQVTPLFGGQFVSVKFSPNSRFISLIEKTTSALILVLHDTKMKQSYRLTQRPVNGVLGLVNQWASDSSYVVTKLVSNGLEKPQHGLSSAAPIIHTSNNEKSAQRTYQHLLATPADSDLFEYLATSDLVKIGLNGRVSSLNETKLFGFATISPNGQHLLVNQLTRPFSYLVRYKDFPLKTSVISLANNKETTITTLPLAETKSSDFDRIRPGYRHIAWRKDTPATLYLVNAIAKSQRKPKQGYREQISLLAAPFTSPPTELLKLHQRFAGIQWHDEQFALVKEKRYSKRLMWTWQFSPSSPSDKKLWHKNAYRDRYTAPGKPLTVLNKYGQSVIYRHNDDLFMAHAGVTKEGTRPSLTIGKSSVNSELAWQSQPSRHERVVKLIDPKKLTAITARQSATEPLNYFYSDLKNNTHIPLTKVEANSGAYHGISKQLVTYKRNDGVDLSGTLYLPKGYKKSDGPLPVLMWAYPREFKDKSVAGQVNYSANHYHALNYKGPMPFLAKGFAVFDKVSMPIIGQDSVKPNDKFREQLIANAQAAVDTLVAMGVADKERIAIGGHSYGAFMVGNLLAHSDLFAAGIARSGAYNRSLTPFGFQSEKRHFWQAQDIYASMSPFFHAEKINEPMLMIHGEADPNSGTFPMQSIRLFNAIKGLGGKARLVLLPYEGHSYKAKESLLHMLAEQEQWLEKYLK